MKTETGGIVHYNGHDFTAADIHRAERLIELRWFVLAVAEEA